MFGTGKPELRTYLDERQQRASKDLLDFDPDCILSENADVLVARIIDSHFPGPLSVDWAAATRSAVSEVLLDNTPGSAVRITFPVAGDGLLLDYQASQFSMGGRPYAQIGESQIEMLVEAHELRRDMIEDRINALRVDIDPRVEWVNRDLERARSQAHQLLHSRLESRKQRLLRDRQLDAALNIPVRASSSPRQPVPAHRKFISLEGRREQAAFTPEPALDEAAFEDILTTIQSWATNLERTPSTLSRLSEEELRDLLLGTLNGYWQGAAGGELFNGGGKTDILVRHNNRNVFIGECKIWGGAHAASEALDQLLTYLVWRDSKAALLMFIKNKSPEETIRRLHTAIVDHGKYLLTKPGGDPARRVDYVVSGDAEGRRLSLAVLPVVLFPR